MVALVEDKLEAVRALCRKHHVVRLELFGSAADGRFDPATSDLDFLVEFDALPPGPYTEAYFDLWESLESLFGYQIDLVIDHNIENPYFRRSVDRTRTVVYAR